MQNLAKENERLKLLIESFLQAGAFGLPMTDKDVKNYHDKPEFKEGWSQCELAHIQRYISLENEKWQSDRNILFLLLTGECWLNQENRLLLNMNDTFAYACADCEEVPEGKVEEIISLYKRHGNNGLIYWVAKQRGEDPGVPEYRKEVQRIRKLEKRRPQ